MLDELRDRASMARTPPSACWRARVRA